MDMAAVTAVLDDARNESWRELLEKQKGVRRTLSDLRL
jgi:hypothetical protein